MRKIWMRIYRDLRDNAQPLVFIAAYIVFMNSSDTFWEERFDG